jgi:tryptophan synthase alpha chain
VCVVSVCGDRETYFPTFAKDIGSTNKVKGRSGRMNGSVGIDSFVLYPLSFILILSRIAQYMERLAAEERQALILNLTVGFPERSAALALCATVIDAGADMIEWVCPFPIRLAEGVTISRRNAARAAQRRTVRYCLETVRTLRERGVEAPLLLMGYLNPLLRYGVDQFCEMRRQQDWTWIILPDLPPEEAG